MFNSTLIHNYANDNMLKTVFTPQCLAVDLVYHLTDDYVGSFVLYTAVFVVLSFFCAALCE